MMPTAMVSQHLKIVTMKTIPSPIQMSMMPTVMASTHPKIVMTLTLLLSITNVDDADCDGINTSEDYM